MTCSTCGREIQKDEPYGYRHKDGRIKHSATWKSPMEALATKKEEEAMAGKTYTAVLDPKDPEDASLVEAAMGIFEDMDPQLGEIVEEIAFPPAEPGVQMLDEPEINAQPLPPAKGHRMPRQTHPVTAEEEAVSGPIQGPLPSFGRPKPEDMITVRGGGLYLTARRRIVWMRGEIIPHPDWTIDTYAEEIERGKFVNKNTVEGGYARYRANIFDPSGRLIGTGTKTEWSERFMDFAEKAETGAIARALAVCGYGTEAALDMDEGLEQDRIADAPVADSRPISITASNVSGLVQGGRSENITQAQLNEIQRLIGKASMGMTLVPFMESVLATTMAELGDDPTATIMAFIKQLSFSEASTLIQALNKVMANA